LAGKGCKKCGFEKVWDSRGRTTTEEFIAKAKKVHKNTYDYSVSKYVKSNHKIKIICRKHGLFEQTPNKHLCGSGCPECARENRSGKNSPRYKDGKSDIRRKERKTPENEKWAKDVKKQKTSCDCCEDVFDKITISHAHHLNSWADYPKERYDLNNGVAICGVCHWEFHGKYGHGENTMGQYYQFKQIKQMENIYG